VLAKHEKQLEILGGMIALAHARGLPVAVEGVETDDHHLLLQELACDLLQGFLLGRPMPPDQIESSLKSVVNCRFTTASSHCSRAKYDNLTNDSNLSD
jgi:EAL domain-containing protein (putative c-di-GMP-specific phosphodiesterase class I)